MWPVYADAVRPILFLNSSYSFLSGLQDLPPHPSSLGLKQNLTQPRRWLRKWAWDSPGSLAVKTPHFQCRGTSSILIRELRSHRPQGTTPPPPTPPHTHTHKKQIDLGLNSLRFESQFPRPQAWARHLISLWSLGFGMTAMRMSLLHWEWSEFRQLTQSLARVSLLVGAGCC